MAKAEGQPAFAQATPDENSMADSLRKPNTKKAFTGQQTQLSNSAIVDTRGPAHLSSRPKQSVIATHLGQDTLRNDFHPMISIDARYPWDQIQVLDSTDATLEAQSVTNDTYAQRLDQLQDTILPALYHITKKHTGKLTKTFDRLHAHDLVQFDEGDVVMVRSEGRRTKAMRPLFGPYVVNARVGQSYELANKTGSVTLEFKDNPVRVELLRLENRSSDLLHVDDLWTEGEVEFRHIISHRMNDDTGKFEYLVRWRERDLT
ncbi:hypothetical protein SARC_01727 [Sphaeroforma arctica JP610]|uniref:Chromo domain-containing protein n=1 Tax=Sphaeroforma arctica JP610 TaxID=667725 RepID=A0A0L0GB51_9EUKA|nr:hypothetical protein SARC_01727 [Sphaeroforma arctica JP610]KNC86111.1 hypothetical protein SARC_01727 [Sphaeroforma arctica JP610]|eukprot:XP_014160013.1 hypothetical protein SARC_01727 [Sphaeroforma arctica JP610]